MQRLLNNHRVAVAVTLISVAVLIAAVATLVVRSREPQPKYTVSNIPLGTMTFMSPLQIAQTLVPDPEGANWCWAEATDIEWEDGYELRTLEHGVPADGEIPAEVSALVEERYRMPHSEFGLQAIQSHRILFAWSGRAPVGTTGIERRAFVVDVRYVTGGGSDEERWDVWDSTSLYYVDDRGAC